MGARNVTKCKDCKGTGVYQGLGAPEPCQRCDGKGKEGQTCFTDVKGSIRQLEGMGRDSGPVVEVPRLKTGGTIYIYDMKWYEAEITRFRWYTGDPFTVYVLAKYAGGGTQIPRSRLKYNIIEKRWEYILAGTPAWRSIDTRSSQR
jgi:hypothetical protein